MRVIQVFSEQPATITVDRLIDLLAEQGAPSRWEDERAYIGVGNITTRGFLSPGAPGIDARVHVEAKTKEGTTDRAWRHFVKKPKLPPVRRKRVALAQSFYNLTTDWLPTPEREAYFDRLVIAIARAANGLVVAEADGEARAWDAIGYRDREGAARPAPAPEASPKERERQGDHALLVRAMTLAATIEGAPKEQALSVIDAHGALLPELAGRDIRRLVQNDADRLAKIGPAEGVASLRGPRAPELRKRAFLAAVDVALATGEVSDAKDELITRMQEALEIEPVLAARIIRVLAQKQASALFGSQE